MREVYKAKDTRLDRTVAIKVLPSRLSDHDELRQLEVLYLDEHRPQPILVDKAA